MTIDRLLKKNNLTGYDIGRIMIADLLELYKKQMNGEPEAKEGVLDLKERTMLVNGIETQEDSRQYNRFKYVHDFLTSIPMQISYNQQLVEHYLFKYFHIIDLTHLAEMENQDRIYHTPLVVSPKVYEELKTSYQAEEKAKEYTPELLFFNELERLVDLYNRGEAPESFYNIIKAMESEPIDNKRIIENFYTVAPKYNYGEGDYYQTKDGRRKDADIDGVEFFELLNIGEVEFIQENQLKEEFLKVWLLPINSDEICYRDCIKGFYYSGCTGDTKTFTEFKQDYPTIYDYVWAILLKAIPALKGCTGAKLFKPCITGEELYNNDLLSYRYKIDSEVKKKGYRDIAILESEAYKESNYCQQAPISTLFSVYRAEKLVDSADVLELCFANIMNGLTELYSINALLEILAKQTDLPDIYNLLKTDTSNYENTIYSINDMIGELCDYGIDRNGTEPLIIDRDYENHQDNERARVPQETLRSIAKKALRRIDYKQAQPSQALIDATIRSFKIEEFYGKGNNTLGMLANSVKAGRNKREEC